MQITSLVTIHLIENKVKINAFKIYNLQFRNAAYRRAQWRRLFLINEIVGGVKLNYWLN